MNLFSTQHCLNDYSLSLYQKINYKRMFPLVFAISLCFLVIAILTSKLQNDSTNLLISIYSALGPIQSAAITLTIAVFISNGHPEIMIKILLIAALAIILLVNLMGYVVQTPFLLTDRKFLKWANRISRKQESRSNLIWFHIISLLSFFTNYKLKMILFSRLFNFQCFKFQLQNVSKFKVFNVLSFIGYFPEILSLYCCISAMAYSTLTIEQLFIFIDLLIIVILNMIFSLIIIKKDDGFFTDVTGGLPMNKIFNLAEEMGSSTHIIARKERQTKEKKRMHLDDISEFDEFAYTSTKRDRGSNLNAFKKQKNKDQDGYYFSENDSDITGSKIHSEVSNQQGPNEMEQRPNEVGCAVAPDDQQQQEEKIVQNILNIDDFYEDESIGGVRNHEQQTINHPIMEQQPLILDQISDEAKLQEQDKQQNNRSRQYANTDNQQQHFSKKTHTKLSQYLMAVQKKELYQQRPQKLEANFKIIQKSIDQGGDSQNNQEKFMLLINESALIDSEPSYIPNEITLNHHQQHQKPILHKQQQQAAKKIVQRVVSAHHSPKKVIQIQGDIKLSKINTFSNSISINEHHDEKPIKNKSVEKAKKLQNHPINVPPHPIYGQKTSKMQQEDESDSVQSLGNRSKIQANPHIIETLKIEQNFFEKLQIDESQQAQPQVPHPKFYEQFIHQNQQSNNSFKRTHPQSLALFSKNNHKNKSMVIDHSSGNNIPRQPVQRLFNNTDNSDLSNDSRFVLKRNFQQAVKFTNNQRERPMTSKQGRFRRFSLQRKPVKGLQGKKMLSLEKIYLQRLNNF